MFFHYFNIFRALLWDIFSLFLFRSIWDPKNFLLKKGEVYFLFLKIYIYLRNRLNNLKKKDCKLKIDRGSCHSFIMMFAYDDILERCIPFTYGGCGGNANRFFTRTQCLATCSHPTTRKIIETTTTKTTSKSFKRKYIIKTKSSCAKPRVSNCHSGPEKLKK